MRIRIFTYIIYLLVICFLMTGISLSRYSKYVGVSHEATVACVICKYVPVSASINAIPIPIENGIDISDALPGDVLVYNFNVKNTDGAYINQILLKYRITVAFSPDPAALPLSYELTPAGSYPSAGDDWTYLGFGVDETHSYSLTVRWDETYNEPEYMSQQQTIQIQIHAEQVDSLS